MINENNPKQLVILVVDDNASMRSVMIGYLRAYFSNVPHQIIEANDGDVAVRLTDNLIKAHQKSYDLIIMDFNMPTLSGQEAALQIRQLETHLPGEHMSKIITWSTAWETPFPGTDIALRKRFSPFDLEKTLDILGFKRTQ